jgi:nitrite reductase/ring-hydroxylating ferredoxin subunit
VRKGRRKHHRVGGSRRHWLHPVGGSRRRTVGRPPPGAGPLAATADVPVGGGVVVNGVLIVQPKSGTFKAYNAACPHQGVQVGAPKKGVITCPGHNSQFKADDGSRISGPASRGLTEIAVAVQGADIVRA